jgi:glycosyltransferase involved in cell wall biosynthesis
VCAIRSAGLGEVTEQGTVASQSRVAKSFATNDGIEPMKIALISNYLPDAQYSMLNYGRMMERLLTARGHTVILLHPPVMVGGLPFLRGGLAKWIRYIDKYVFAGSWLRWKCRGADLVHVCDHSNSMYLKCAGKRPRVITCHDLIAVRGALGYYREVQVGKTGRMLQKWIATSLARAEYIICVSNNTLAEFRSVCAQSKAKCRVIHTSLNRNCSAASLDEVKKTLAGLGLAADSRYFLHIGGNNWYKNRIGAMRIFAELRKSPEFRDARLILAGKPWTREMRELAQLPELQGATVEAADQSDEALNALYTGALALLFPSLIEGYGWPILEAQACGCPVITTNRPPMTEVAGDAAILIDPDDTKGAARIILEQWPGLASLRDAGFRNLARFAESTVMDAYEQVYTEVRRAWKA